MVFFFFKDTNFYNALLLAYPNTQNIIISHWSAYCEVNKSFDYYALEYYWLAIIAATFFVLLISGKIKSLLLIWFSRNHRRVINVDSFTHLQTHPEAQSRLLCYSTESLYPLSFETILTNKWALVFFFFFLIFLSSCFLKMFPSLLHAPSLQPKLHFSFPEKSLHQ